MIQHMPLNYTLSKYIKSHAINEYECKLLISEILSTIWTLHKAKLVHCDLKPHNIMFGTYYNDTKHEYKRWNVIDFGLIVTNGTTTGYRGTYRWTAPEINMYNKESIFSYAVDIWSIGLIILYALIIY
eukprot:167815_1